MNFLVGGLLTKVWKRNLVALADGAVYIYNTVRDYGRRPALTLWMSECYSVCTYQNDRYLNKPADPPYSSAENGFVLRVGGKINFFVAETMEEAM